MSWNWTTARGKKKKWPCGGSSKSGLSWPLTPGEIWAAASCLHDSPQIEDGGVRVLRRAPPLHRRRQWRHTATFRAAASATRDQNQPGRGSHKPLEQWVDAGFKHFASGLSWAVYPSLAQWEWCECGMCVCCNPWSQGPAAFELWSQIRLSCPSMLSKRCKVVGARGSVVTCLPQTTLIVAC